MRKSSAPSLISRDGALDSTIYTIHYTIYTHYTIHTCIHTLHEEVQRPVSYIQRRSAGLYYIHYTIYIHTIIYTHAYIPSMRKSSAPSLISSDGALDSTIYTTQYIHYTYYTYTILYIHVYIPSMR